MNQIEKLKARIEELVRIADVEYERRVKAEAELARRDALESFMFAIINPNEEPHMDEDCVSTDYGFLEDQLWDLNDGLAENEPKYRVIPLFTAAPAPFMPPKDPPVELMAKGRAKDASDRRQGFEAGWHAHRAAILKGGK